MKFSSDDMIVKNDFQKVIEYFNGKIAGMNSASNSATFPRLMNALEIKLSQNELNTWQRKNDASHENESENLFIKMKEIRILRILLNRILLKILQVGSTYIDHCSLEAKLPPIKKLEESII